MLGLTNRTKVFAKQFCAEDGSQGGALLSINGKLRDELVQRFKDNYSVEGNHIRNGGAISPKSMLALIGSGSGALGMSYAKSGTLFMATADPNTLMAIGKGVGSAVMKAGGGVARHAPFIPVAGALMPVLAPLIAFQAISTIMIMNQFKGIHARLDHIEKSISRVLQRSEATYIGEMLSASNRIQEIETRFGVCNQFTPEMAIRLALVEDKANPIFERYKFLYSTQDVEQSVTPEDLKFKQNDAYFAVVLSILDLRIDVLRLKLAIQEDAGYMRHAAQSLVAKTESYQSLWIDIGRNPERISGVADELRDTVRAMNWWQRTMPRWLAGKRADRIKTERKADVLQEHATSFQHKVSDDLAIARDFGETIKQNVTDAAPMSLIYWRDENGEHSYYTNDLEILPGDAMKQGNPTQLSADK